ncbi:MAG: serine/threonine-protein kinase [Thermoguttaceae bacterium]|jgi:serine/threonine-protein kinase
MTIEETEEMLGEALVLSRIGHPNIIRVFDANTTDTSRGMCGFFTMEYVAGGSLERFWRSHGTRFVPVETAIDLIRQVCRGLAVAHQEQPPLVHRDIKPQNILVGYEPDGLRARVSDFGLAKHVNPLTLLASARGTPCFKPPEVFEDPQRDSCAGDVWAIGSTLYLLLTDRLPYGDLGETGALDPKCLQRPLAPPSRLNVQVDADLDSIVARSLATNPKDRYASAGAMLEDLAAWKPRPSKGSARALPAKSWEASKGALGTWSPGNQSEARKMIAKAVEFSRKANALNDAADLMEEAFNKWPDLRTQYEYQLKLWRRGVSM